MTINIKILYYEQLSNFTPPYLSVSYCQYEQSDIWTEERSNYDRVLL